MFILSQWIMFKDHGQGPWSEPTSAGARRKLGHRGVLGLGAWGRVWGFRDFVVRAHMRTPGPKATYLHRKL